MTRYLLMEEPSAFWRSMGEAARRPPAGTPATAAALTPGAGPDAYCMNGPEAPEIPPLPAERADKGPGIPPPPGPGPISCDALPL